MVVPAPGLLSTMTDCPSSFDSASPYSRATLSAPPPAGKPMTRRIGLDGKASAASAGPASADADASRNSRVGCRLVIVVSGFCVLCLVAPASTRLPAAEYRGALLAPRGGALAQIRRRPGPRNLAFQRGKIQRAARDLVQGALHPQQGDGRHARERGAERIHLL